MLHDDYLCLVESGKQQIKEVRRKLNRKTWKPWQLLSESGFVLRTAPPPLSSDRGIKMKKSNQSNIKSSLHLRITPNHVTSGGAHLRDLAPGQHSSEKTSKQWRAVGDTVPI